MKVLATGAPSPDVVAMYLDPGRCTEPGTIVLAGWPQFRAVRIAPPHTDAYGTFLSPDVAPGASRR